MEIARPDVFRNYLLSGLVDEHPCKGEVMDTGRSQCLRVCVQVKLTSIFLLVGYQRGQQRARRVGR